VYHAAHACGTLSVMPQPLPLYAAFGIGTAGAFVVYCLLYRDSRISAVWSSPREKWPILVFDLIIFLICGGLVAAFYAEPTTLKQAFTAGCAWQGLAGSLFAGTELRAHEQAAAMREARGQGLTRTPKAKGKKA
jgi:hypothetical protein